MTGAPEYVRHAHGVYPSVSSWRDGDLLADALPVVGGRVTARADSNVRETVYLTFPRTRDMIPTTPDHPLAHYGQRLTVQQTITYGGESIAVPIGQYLIMGHDVSGDFVELEAVSLEQLLLEYRLTTPRQPPASATFASELRALVANTVPVVIDTATLTDRALPNGISTEWVEDRWGAIADLMAAWPAEWTMNSDGQLTVTAPAEKTDDADREWVHGADNAYVSWRTSGVRDRIFNAVVARGTDGDGVDVWAMAKAERGPTAYGGPFGRRQRFYYSPLLTSKSQCETAARNMLRQELRRTTTVEIEAPPDPTLALGITGAVTDEHGDRYAGLVVGYSLPVHAGGGPMSVTLGEVDA